VAAQLDDRDQLEPDVLGRAFIPRRLRPARLLACDLALEPLALHLVDAEGLHHPAQHVVRRRVAVLELVEPRLHLGLDEAPDHVPDPLVLLAPLEHRLLTRSVTGDRRRCRPTRTSPCPCSGRPGTAPASSRRARPAPRASRCPSAGCGRRTRGRARRAPRGPSRTTATPPCS